MELKNLIDQIEQGTDEIEDLLNGLETELIEWNALQKLIRRDEELEECDSILRDISDEIQDELKDMNAELKKQNQKVIDK